MITRELVGRALGVVLLAALMFGIPYLTLAYVLWELDPSLWPTSARAMMVAGTLILAGLYTASKLPEGEAKPRDPYADRNFSA